MSLPLTHAGLSAPGISAALDLKFASTLSLTSSSGITPSFSRASSGTYFGSDGLLKYVPYNLLSYSEDLTNAAWTDKVGATITGDATSSPIGTLTADRVQITGAGLCMQKKAYTATGNHVFSIWIKAPSATVACIRISNDAGTQSYTFNCNVTTEWQRFSVTGNWSSNPVNFYAGFDQRSVVGGPGAATDIFVWGAQLETGSTPGTYVPTTSAANSAPRFDHTYNGTSWISRGLLVEEQRTNSAQYSEDLSNAYWTKAGLSISANNAVAPDGNTTADKAVESAANVQHTFYNSGFSVTSGTAYTISFFAKASGRNFIQFQSATTLSGASSGTINFDLASGVLGTVSGTNTSAEIVNVGNGWYRCIVKISSASSTGTGFIQLTLINSATASFGQAYLGDGTSGVLVWGIQLEASGAFATSYIPSLSNSSTTRSADVCQITGSDFSSFWNASEGSVALSYDCPAVGTLVQWQANSSTSTNIHAAVSIGNTQYLQVFLPPEQALINSGLITANNQNNLSYAYKANDFAASLNGASAVTDTAGSLPNPNKLIIGSDGSTYINGHISRLRYFNKRLTNSQLVKLST
jgi:hypothetical protein